MNSASVLGLPFARVQLRPLDNIVSRNIYGTLGLPTHLVGQFRTLFFCLRGQVSHTCNNTRPVWAIGCEIQWPNGA